MSAASSDSNTLIDRGNALEDAGDVSGALALYQSAINLAPDSPRAWVNLGNALQLLNRLEEARHAFQTASAGAPFAPAELNLGNLLMRMNAPADALVHYRAALELRVGWDQAQLGLCLAMHQQRDPQLLAQLRQTARMHPHLKRVRWLLASMLADHECEEALQVLEREPSDAQLLERAGRLRLNLLDHQGAVRNFERALQLEPGNAAYASNYAFYSLYDGAHPPERLLGNLDRHCQASGINAHIELPQRRSPHVRVAYISGDFVTHSLMHYAYSLFEGHDRSRFRVIGISSTDQPDEVTAELKERVDEWIDIAQLSDDEACALIRKRQVDILIDLSGHTQANRLGVLARRAAPVQMTTMGVLSSTGMPNIDYRIVDFLTDPPGMTEAWHREALLRMPRFNGCYSQRREIPRAVQLPAWTNGYLTFGYFNHANKLNRPSLSMWGEILQRIPGSRLRLLGIQHPATRRVIEQELVTGAGIGAERIDIRGRVSLAEFSQLMTTVDIAFDPYPYSGGITTIETLLAGVPLVTQAGTRSSSRNGLAILGTLGLQDWIAATRAQFVELACRHARDLSALDRLRQQLPQRVAASPLMDRRAFIADWEDLLWSTQTRTGAEGP